MSVAGLFAGIGGFEQGFRSEGLVSELLCEIEPAARSVLRKSFPDVPLRHDVRSLKRLPPVNVVTAGFPCQDLSQAGKTAGIQGSQSSLIGEVFRLVGRTSWSPRWLVLENVPFMLQLDRGRAMAHLVAELEALGFTWAYRVVDTRSFGLPQRRQRVVLVASRTEDPGSVLFPDDAGEPADATNYREVACGFYWTEGTRGLGWAVDAIPTLKGGSTIGIPSPPAIWMPDGRIVTPEIRDAERLQGFPVDWTLPALSGPKKRKGARWKLVGNAVSVPMASWLGRRLVAPGTHSSSTRIKAESERWPRAAWGHKGMTFSVDVSAWPMRVATPPLAEFLRFPLTLLSERASSGFFNRTKTASLKFPDGFLDAVAEHVKKMQEANGSHSRAVA